MIFENAAIASAIVLFCLFLGYQSIRHLSVDLSNREKWLWYAFWVFVILLGITTTFFNRGLN